MAGTYSFTNLVRDLGGPMSIALSKAPKLIRAFGVAPNARAHKHEWLDLSLSPGTFTATAHNGSGTLTAAAGEVAKIKAGTLLSVAGDPGLFQVTTLAASPVIALVAQNGGAYSAISGLSTDGASFEIVGHPAKEGSEAGDDGISQGAVAYNYTQIFRKDINISATAIASGVYNDENAFDVQTAYALQQLSYEMNRVAIKGVRSASSSSAAGRAGGLYSFGSLTAVNGNSAAISIDLINDAGASLVSAGGNPDIIACSPAQARVLTAALSDRVRILNGDANRGDYVASIVNDLTGVPMMLIADNDIAATDAWVIDSSCLGISWLRAMQDSDTTTPGTDGFRRTVIGECTFEFRNPSAKTARIYGLIAAASALSAQRAAVQSVSIVSSEAAPVFTQAVTATT